MRDEDSIELEFTEEGDKDEDYSQLVKPEPEENLKSKFTFGGYI